MRIVEIIGGARTAPQTLQKLKALVATTSHAGVEVQDTPGFLINHAGRGYTTEALRAVQEGVAGFAEVDAIMREQVRFASGGFKLGPFELLDLTGLDVSQPVMESIYRQFYDEPRFRPSVIGAQRAAAGLLRSQDRRRLLQLSAGGAAARPAAPARRHRRRARRGAGGEQRRRCRSSSWPRNMRRACRGTGRSASADGWQPMPPRRPMAASC